MKSPWVATVHLHTLTGFGYSHEQIARRAGISSRTVGRILDGTAGRIHARVERAILAVTPTLDDLDPGTLISNHGVRRRVEALGCLGWSLAALAGELGISREAFSARIHAASATVRTHREVAGLYDRLWNTPPTPASPELATYIVRTRKRAAALGWVPPMAWDDIDTDPAPPVVDDAVVLDELAIEFATQGTPVHLTREERQVVVVQLHAAGYTDVEMGVVLCVADRTIARDRFELNLPSNARPAQGIAA
jgi:AraC-like DNA-binding protein